MQGRSRGDGGEMEGRYRGDGGEMEGRCRGDVGEMQGRCRRDVGEIWGALLELLLVGGQADDQVVLLLLEVGPLLAHHQPEELVRVRARVRVRGRARARGRARVRARVRVDLVLEALECDRKVDDGHLDAHLGQVVRVGQLGGEVEAEGVVVVDVAVAHTDEVAPALLEHLLLQHRLERRVELLAHVLKDDLV